MCGCVGVCVVRGGGRETARVVVPQSFVEFARGGTKLTSLESLLDTQPHRPRRGRGRSARSSSSSTRAIERVSFSRSLLAPQSSTRAPSLLGARVFERAPSCGSRSTSSRFETRASRREALSGAPQVSAWIVCEPTTTNHSSSHVLPLDQSISSQAASGSRRHSLTLSLSSLLRASIFEGERERCDCCCCWGRYLRGSGYWRQHQQQQRVKMRVYCDVSAVLANNCECLRAQQQGPPDCASERA